MPYSLSVACCMGAIEKAGWSVCDDTPEDMDVLGLPVMNKDGALALLLIETELNGEKTNTVYGAEQMSEYGKVVKEKFNGEFLGCFRCVVKITALDEVKEKYKVELVETGGFPVKLAFAKDINMAKYLDAPEYSLSELFAAALEETDWFQMGCIMSESVVFSEEVGELKLRGKTDCLQRLDALVDGWKKDELWEQLWFENGIMEIDGVDYHCCLVINDKEVIKEFLMTEKAGRLASVMDAKIDQFVFED